MFSTAGLARFSARHPWYIVGIWVLLLVLAGVAATGLGGALTTEGDFTNRPESVRAEDLLKKRMRAGQDQPVTETVIVRSETATVDDPAFQQVVAQTAAGLRALPEIVANVTTYDEAVAAGAPDAAGMVSADRHTALIAVTLVGKIDTAADNANAYLDAIAAQKRDGYQVLTVGDISVGERFTKLAESDLVKGEGLGLLAALIVLVIVFGALVAAGVPIVLAIVAIFVAVGMTALVGRVMELSFFVVNMITMIGLAVGIDYALFIVSRYREERARGRDQARGDRDRRRDREPRLSSSPAARCPGAAGHVPAADRDLPQPRRRGDPGGARGRGCHADAGAGDAQPARRQDRLAAADRYDAATIAAQRQQDAEMSIAGSGVA